MKQLIFGLVVLVISLTAANESDAGPIFVSYTVSGSSGNFDLDFSVTNNVITSPTNDQNVYLFGVRLSANAHITHSPANFFDQGADLNWVGYGGTSTEYNNNWRDGFKDLLPGNTLSGFIVHDTDLVAPTAVSWFAVSFGTDQYTGGGNFITNRNPGFEDIATPADTAVPEPSSFVMSLLLFGMFSVVWSYKRLRQTAIAA